MCLLIKKGDKKSSKLFESDIGSFTREDLAIASDIVRYSAFGPVS